MAQDGSFKRLIELDPLGVLPALLPDIVKILGLPMDATVVASEVLPLAHDSHSRLMDAAIRYRWSTGHQAVILQVEHWSRTRHLSLRRAARYATDLMVRYPAAVVLPVMVLCDQPSTPPKDRLHITVAGQSVLDFRVCIPVVVGEGEVHATYHHYLY